MNEADYLILIDVLISQHRKSYSADTVYATGDSHRIPTGKLLSCCGAHQLNLSKSHSPEAQFHANSTGKEGRREDRLMFTCFTRYWIEPNKLEEFHQYAHTWISLIKKYGGTHHGYFIPGTDDDNLPDPTFSFPGLGTEGPVNVAVALFSFPSIEAYEQYRLAVANDEACKAATVRFNETKCFSSYERTFLVPIFE